MQDSLLPLECIYAYMWNCFAVCKYHANDGGSPCWAYIQCVLPGVTFNSSQVPSCFLTARKNFGRAVWNPLWCVELRNLFHGGMLLFAVIDTSVQIHPIGKNGGLEGIPQTPTQCVCTSPDSEILMLISHVTFEPSLHYSRALLLTHHVCKTYLKCLLKTQFVSPMQDQFSPSLLECVGGNCSLGGSPA